MHALLHCTRFGKRFEGYIKNVLYSIGCLAFFHTPQLLAGESIVLSPGRQKIITISDVLRATVTNENIAAAEIQADQHQIVVTALSMGKTRMTVWLDNGKKDEYFINVHENTSNDDPDVRQLLSGVEGIEIKNTPSGVSVNGQIYRSEDLELVQKTLKQYPQIQNNTKINVSTLEYLQKIMLLKLHDQGFDQIQITKAGDTLYLEGFVNSKLEKTRAEKMAKTIYIKTENHIELGIENKNLILVDIKFMEVLKNSLNNLGIQWPQHVDVGTNVGMNGRSFSTVLSSQSTVALNALIEKGDAKVLSNPKLLCQSGFPASFDAGGEIPIRMISERSANVFFKSYGLHLDINAKSDAGKRASIEVQSRISDLDMATAIDGIPGILEHKVNTAVNLNFGQTVALAGLIESKKSKSTAKVPFLGHIPVLGELFKSRNFRNSLSEFVVFLTPILANGNDAYHMQQKNSMDEQWIQKDRDLKFKLTD